MRVLDRLLYSIPREDAPVTPGAVPESMRHANAIYLLTASTVLGTCLSVLTLEVMDYEYYMVRNIHSAFLFFILTKH